MTILLLRNFEKVSNIQNFENKWDKMQLKIRTSNEITPNSSANVWLVLR